MFQDRDRPNRTVRSRPSDRAPLRPTSAALALALALAAPALAGDDDDLRDWFGFAALEVLKIGDDAGPLLIADMNGDGRNDLVIANNRASRIEIHLQRSADEAEGTVEAPTEVNEPPEHWRFRRVAVPVVHRVVAIVPHDMDGDGRMDLLYAGAPPELVVLRQRDDGGFERALRRPARSLSASRAGLVLADLVGDAVPELALLEDGRVRIRPFTGDGDLGEATDLGSAENVAALLAADLDGNGRADLVAIAPEEPAPVRCWLAPDDAPDEVPGPELRFEMPALVECRLLRRPGDDRALVATVERPTRRLVIHRLEREPSGGDADAEAALRIRAFTDTGRKSRPVVLADVDGDGLEDLVAADASAAALVVHRQAPGRGLGAPTQHPSLRGITHLEAGDVDGDGAAELFVLSPDDGIVGRVDADGDALAFPEPMRLEGEGEPVAIALVDVDGAAMLAVVTRSERTTYDLQLLAMDGTVRTVPLDRQSRAPDAVRAFDADGDGRTDLLVVMPDRPPILLHGEADGFRRLEGREVGQVGLVRAATAANTALRDLDGDGRDELVIAAGNVVRGVRFDPAPPAGVNPGWQVATQINLDDASIELAALAGVGDRLWAVDKSGDRLVELAPRDGAWTETSTRRVRGFPIRGLRAGRLGADGGPGIVALGDDAFAVVEPGGGGPRLAEIETWRPASDRHFVHELAAGDVNADGFLDLVAIDAGERRCEILTFDALGALRPALSWEIFESRIFASGEPRSYEPRQAFVADVTADGRADVVMLAHDRVLVYVAE